MATKMIVKVRTANMFSDWQMFTLKDMVKPLWIENVNINAVI